MIGAFVAVSANGVIGLDGGLPWRYPEDMKRFKSETMGSTIIMGRKTWNSFPKRPLPGRRNIIISRGTVEGVEHYDSVEKAINAADEPIWIIGGGEIYALALPYCDTIDMTLVPDVIEDAEAVRFPELDDDWNVVESWINENDARLSHRIYKKPKTASGD